MGFHILIDWVPNHSAWDNTIAAEHPEWYMKDSAGNFIPPLGTDWTDVIQLDWSQKGLQNYMIEAFKFWKCRGWWVQGGPPPFRRCTAFGLTLGFAEKVCGALDTRRKGEAVY
jgi:hypothetical protein